MATGRRPKLQVKLYTRPDCHLCDEAKREMTAADCEDLYEYEEIDVDSDPEMRRRYGWDVPVITVNGALAFKHRLTRDAFRDKLLRASAS